MQRAIDRTNEVLFEGFSFEKWFKLGFCAWLANLGDGGGGGGSSNTYEDVPLAEGAAWVEANTMAVLAILVAVVVFLILIVLLVSWLSARGTFMFLDGIVRDRGAVAEPWGKFRGRGNRLFVAKAVVGLATSFLVLAAMLLGIAIAWPDIASERFQEAALLGLIVGAGGVLVSTLSYWGVNFFLRNFVAPTMYLHDVGVLEAWNLIRAEVIAGHAGTVFCYFLMRVGIAIVAVIIAMLSICLTCCLTAIPYLGTVILLPLFVFERSYGMYFLEQFGERWRFFDASSELVEA